MATPGNSITGGARRGERHQNVEALFIRDYFRRWLARFELGAHFLNLSCLLFELRSENLHLFLLQGDGRFQVSDTGLLFLDLFVFFEELVEQHHADLLVADRVWPAFSIATHQVRIHFRDFFGNQSKQRDSLGVVLSVEGDGFEREDRFTGFIHRLDVLFVPRGRGESEDLVSRWIGQNGLEDDGGRSDTGDKTTLGIQPGESGITAEAHRIAFVTVVEITTGVIAQIDIVAPRGDSSPRFVTHSRVSSTGGKLERIITEG